MRLYGLKTTAVANRIDRYKVLFNVDGGNAPFALVHLSWRKESDPRWPSIRLFASWDEEGHQLLRRIRPRLQNS
jgi:hypothetical protein